MIGKNNASKKDEKIDKKLYQIKNTNIEKMKEYLKKQSSNEPRTN
jgi:hypothetical protein